jgi:hypothetical protein
VETVSKAWQTGGKITEQKRSRIGSAAKKAEKAMRV